MRSMVSAEQKSSRDVLCCAALGNCSQGSLDIPMKKTRICAGLGAREDLMEQDSGTTGAGRGTSTSTTTGTDVDDS